MSSPMYQAFVLIPPEHEATLDPAEAAIREAYARRSDSVKIARAGDRALQVTIGSYGFRVALMLDGALSEAQDIAASAAAKDRPDTGLIASCPARFEVWAADFDDSISYLSDYEKLVAAVERAFPGAIPFEPGVSIHRTNGNRASFLRPPAKAPSKAKAPAKQKKARTKTKRKAPAKTKRKAPAKKETKAPAKARRRK